MQFLNQHTSKYCEYLAQSLNNKLQVDMIIMDFSQAFDTVAHNRLLNKLNRYGIRNKTHNWISNFFKYRKQRVVIGGEHSTWTQVISGVPQGTLLGPLLFLTYTGRCISIHKNVL